MISELNRAIIHEAFVKKETTAGTLVFPAATDFVIPAGYCNLNQQPTFTDSEEIINSRSLINRFQDMTGAGNWSVPMYLRPSGSAGSVPQGSDLLEAMFGTETIVAATSVTYSLATTKPSFSLWERCGKTVFFAKGCTASKLALNITNKGAVKMDLSGQFMEMGWVGTDQVKGVAPAAVVIEDCEDAWDELVDADVTESADAVDFKTGTASAKFVVAAGCGAGDIIATEAFVSKDMSGDDSLKLWVKSSVALDAGDLQILLDDTAECASPLKELDIPAVAADTWTEVDIDLGDASGLTAVISIGVKMIVDVGAFNLWIDDVRSFTDDTTIEVDDAKLFCVGGRVQFKNADGTVFNNSDAGYEITDVDTSTDIITVSPGAEVGLVIDDYVEPYLPTGTKIGSVAEARETTVSFDGGSSAAVIKSMNLNIDDAVQYQEDEITSEGYPTTYVEGRRSVAGNVSLLFRTNDLAYFYDGLNTNEVDMQIKCGVDAAGTRLTINMDKVSLPVPARSYTAPTVELTMDFVALGTDGEDEIEFVLD
jgi:hypothetical protein